MDNRVFNVNGLGKDRLRDTLYLAFEQCRKARGYIIDPKKGMLLLWGQCDGIILFPTGLNSDGCAELVWSWLQSEPEVECVGFDENLDDPDVMTELGWRVYCEDWGHIGDNHYTIVAVKPAYMWCGK